MVVIVVLVIVVIFIYFISKSRSKTVGTVHSNKAHYFDKLQFSAQEFYATLESIIKERQMPDVKISRVEYHEKHIFSNKRQYLRIERKNDIFDVCAAPFGTGFFVSYWHGEPKKRALELAMKTPYLSTAVEGWQGTTYYQLDLVSMFKLCVKDGITEAIDQVTKAKGVRGLSEAERMAFSS